MGILGDSNSISNRHFKVKLNDASDHYYTYVCLYIYCEGLFLSLSLTCSGTKKGKKYAKMLIIRWYEVGGLHSI